MKTVEPGEITSCVEDFLREGQDTPASRRRERSWDFCFNHFQDHERPTQVMELSCLHLGYYLASWGMLRGSSFLFRETNLLHYRPVIEVIETHNSTLRGTDVVHYRDADAAAHIWSAWSDLRKALVPHGARSITLVSKVMMGVWGCLPSFDTYFIKTFAGLAETKAERGALANARAASLGLLADFYDAHAVEIDSLRDRYGALDFESGARTARKLTRAKVIDIFGFQRAYAHSSHPQ